MTQEITQTKVEAQRLGLARLAVIVMFFVNGVAGASWATRIPVAQQQLHLSAGALGIVLLGAPVGAVIAMPLSGALSARWGSRIVTRVAMLALCASLPLLALAASPLLLALALAAFGASNGAMDVAMNTQGAAVERGQGQPIMSSFHGMYSLGGLAGAAAGGFVAALGVALLPHLLIAGVLLGAGAAVASIWLLPPAVDVASEEPAFAWPTRALLALGLIAFCVMLGEGAMADWSAVYLRRTLATDAAFAAAGYATFSLAMAVGRFSGDWLSQRLGSVWMLRLGGMVAALGLGASLVFAQPVVALVGFGCVGLGFATIVPLALSAAGRTPTLAPGTAIAAVATTGYFGFLAGPPAIGGLAGLFTLRAALWLVVSLSALIVILAPHVRSAPTSR